jgi:hypothetical protein
MDSFHSDMCARDLPGKQSPCIKKQITLSPKSGTVSMQRDWQCRKALPAGEVSRPDFVLRIHDQRVIAQRLRKAWCVDNEHQHTHDE